jgi:esterase/lipase superfamily enzyme
MRRYGKPRQPFVVILSRDDRALELSKTIAGDKQRVGDYNNDQELANLGVVVVDLSGVKGVDRSNHWKFAQMNAYPPQVIALLQQSGIALPEAEAVQRGNAVDRIGSTLGDFVASATNVVVALPNALAGR